jgi:hypothetical protein
MTFVRPFVVWAVIVVRRGGATNVPPRSGVGGSSIPQVSVAPRALAPVAVVQAAFCPGVKKL